MVISSFLLCSCASKDNYLSFKRMYLSEISVRCPVHLMFIICEIPHSLSVGEIQAPTSLIAFLLLNFALLTLLLLNTAKCPTPVGCNRLTCSSSVRLRSCPCTSKSLKKIRHTQQITGGQNAAPWTVAMQEEKLPTSKNFTEQKAFCISRKTVEVQQIHQSQDVAASQHIESLSSIFSKTMEVHQIHQSQHVAASQPFESLSGVAYIGYNGSQAASTYATRQEPLPLSMKQDEGTEQEDRSASDLDKRFDDFIDSFFARVRAEIRDARDSSSSDSLKMNPISFSRRELCI
ncbi:hypothetical protein KP509_11G028500 [Ceratopteris richardii]|uniref:Uncharacterized protein n=1 Tax=Ceratopteris richardii TaxID=49495 RepID=A0A8T2TND7_CERRI|nr:hypothetical protein KP509_11G028500 [Ceratopteris richardii]